MNRVACLVLLVALTGAACTVGAQAVQDDPLDRPYFRSLGYEWFPGRQDDFGPWLAKLKRLGFNSIQTASFAPEISARGIAACHDAGIAVFTYARLGAAGEWLGWTEEDYQRHIDAFKELIDVGFDGVVYDFSTWERFPKDDMDAPYWKAAVDAFNRHSDGTWTPESLAEAIKQDEGRFGKEGGITRAYNSFRCAFHAAKAKELADLATQYAAEKGRRFWLGFYLPDTNMLGTDYRMLDKATPLMCPMIYGPVETGNPDQMRGETDYHVPQRPRNSKAIVCVEAGFPDTGGRKSLPIVMRAVWATMLSNADGYALWHAAFASEESEIAISNLNKICQWVIEPLMQGQADQAKQGLSEWRDFVQRAMRKGTDSQLMRWEKVSVQLEQLREQLNPRIRTADQIPSHFREPLYQSAVLAWEIQQSELISKTRSFELTPFSFDWRKETGFLRVSCDDLGMTLWQDNKAGNIDDLRIQGLAKNVAAGSRGDWGFCRQRGSLDEWGYRSDTNITEQSEQRVVVETVLNYQSGVRSVRTMTFQKSTPVIRIEFKVFNDGTESAQVKPQLWNCLNLGPEQTRQIRDMDGIKLAIVRKGEMFAVMAATTKPVDYAHEWGNGSQNDLFDMKSSWQLAPGEARSLHFWFTIGRGAVKIDWQRP